MSNGRFVWCDLHSTDVEASKAFFTGLLGWTTEDADMVGMIYTMVGVNGENFGGVVPVDLTTGAPSHWASYLTVEDVDAATAKATALGSTVFYGPDDIPGVGRFASIADPQGAGLNLFKLVDDESTTAPMPTPIGGVSWNELLSSDAEASREFYSQMVGWTYEQSTSGGGGDYWHAKQGAESRAGIMAKPPMMPASAWIIYFAVADIDAAIAKTKELGGQSYMEPIALENVGKMVYVSDPTGAPFALIQEAMM
jgi:predicted enzyme related to lactoylglutathione lyase